MVGYLLGSSNIELGSLNSMAAPAVDGCCWLVAGGGHSLGESSSQQILRLCSNGDRALYWRVIIMMTLRCV